jgi:tetratricopeptide (TPR) repeat protein
MSFWRTLAVLSVFIFSACCWTEEIPLTSVDNAKLGQLLTEGAQLAQSRKPVDAISYFDRIIAGYEEAYKGEEANLYCARWQIDSLMYLVEAGNAKTSAKLVSTNWAYAYYLKAYSLLDLGRISEAKPLLERAIALSPRNSQFLSEMGNIYQRDQNWPKALEVFMAAEAAAREFSPQGLKNIELSRAMRGLGYVYIEQGKLDDAEKMYRQCLELDDTDSKEALRTSLMPSNSKVMPAPEFATKET